ncbi:META and DUF4377 domain-containing protein [Chitinibacter sp. GC72]|uniref:META and DUF4377 domain-containing protein n=1 Tax=Chitinibacter sp. GC72 TaxID=1526917 RepID=UPI0018E0397B|nr:META and DUF4377 domain-containing protein [Chitinibacter sp. GC72]
MNKLILILVGLGGFHLAHAAETTGDTSATAATRLAGDYQLVELNARPVSSFDRAAITLTISADGKLSGFAGCNQFHGKLTAEPLRIGPVASTRKLCADPAVMQQEQAFLNALNQASALERIAPSGLILRAQANQSLQFMLFAKPVEKVIWVGPRKKDCVAGVMKTQCLQYKTSKNSQWLNFYGEIAGFDWQEGKRYKLKVREEQIANPPADASSIKTSLVKVLSSR